MSVFQIWRRATSSTYIMESALSPTKLEVVKIAEGVFEIVPESPMPFQSGYCLGLFHPPRAKLNIQYSPGSTEEENYYDITGSFTTPPSLFFHIFGSRQSVDHPLVYVETGEVVSGHYVMKFCELRDLN